MYKQTFKLLEHIVFEKELKRRVNDFGRETGSVPKTEYIDIRNRRDKDAPISSDQESFIKSYQNVEKHRDFFAGECSCNATLFRTNNTRCVMGLTWDDEFFSDEDIKKLEHYVEKNMSEYKPKHSYIRDLLLWYYEREPSHQFFTFMTSEVDINITASDITEDAKALAAYFLSKGLNGKRVVFLSGTSFEMITAFFALTAIGGTVVIIDPQLPCCKLTEMIAEINAKAIAGEKSFLSEFSDCDLPTFDFSEFKKMTEEGKKLISEGIDPFENYELDPETEAVILFTSGTTGSGKAVGCTHKMLTGYAKNTMYSMEWFETALLFVPLYHIAGITLLFSCMYGGAVLIVIPDYRMLIEAVAAKGVQYTLTVPRIADMLLLWLKGNGTDIRDKMPNFGLKYISVSGARSKRDYKSEFELYGIEACDTYGMTETCGAIIFDGFPAKDAMLKIEGGGTVGKLWVKSPLLFSGYLNDADGSEAIFKDGWFYTGDIARKYEDGRCFIVGRAKNLIVLSNGENVSPEELEEILQKSEVIEEALVFESEDMLAAEIYPNESLLNKENDVLKKEIEAEVKLVCSDLPSYMKISKVIVIREPLKKNALGKLIRSNIVH